MICNKQNNVTNLTQDDKTCQIMNSTMPVSIQYTWMILFLLKRHMLLASSACLKVRIHVKTLKQIHEFVNLQQFIIIPVNMNNFGIS